MSDYHSEGIPTDRRGKPCIKQPPEGDETRAEPIPWDFAPIDPVRAQLAQTAITAATGFVAKILEDAADTEPATETGDSIVTLANAIMGWLLENSRHQT